MSALAGIRVLDFSAMAAGPYCTKLMADLGAEVVKVEPPEGDYMRTRPPLRDGASLYFGVLNAGKRSLALDLKQAQGRALALELAASSDVLVENFRPGVMQRLGLDRAALSALNPGLVYVSISGYGQQGSLAQLPAYAPIVQAACGLDVATMGHQRLDRPPRSGIFIADYLTGVHAFGAACAALVRRARTGRGESIDCALMDAMLGMLGYEVAEAQQPPTAPRPLYQASKARDGFIMLAPISQANFDDLARVIDRADLKLDPRFADATARALNWDALMAEVERWTTSRSVDDCESAMRAGGVPCARYRSVAEVMDSRYAAERGLFETVRVGNGRMKVTNPPFRMPGAGTAGAVPGLGEHGAQLLAQRLGKSEAEIEQLRACGALCLPHHRAQE